MLNILINVCKIYTGPLSVQTQYWLHSQSQSHIATDGRSVSLGAEPHPGLMTRHLLLFDSVRSFCGTPSLTRGRVCHLYMLLALASAVFLGSESLVIRDHILLSQI
jgi:hypothetical protein